jgi:hypothetical protein
VASQTIDSVRDKLVRELKASFPDVSVDDDGDIMFRHGDVITWIRALEWEGGRTLVRVWSITNVGMRVDGDLTKLLLTTNGQLAFGGFRLDESVPAVVIEHSLLGDYVNRTELEATVAAVTGAAQEFGPRIKSSFGGQLFSES